MEPTISVNYFAVTISVVSAMALGFLWFGPLFGRRWAEHMGLADMEQPDGRAMAKSMLNFAIGNFLIVFVLAHGIEVWRASSWGLTPDLASWEYAVDAGFFTWLGFFLPLQMGRVAWERRRWGLVAINASFDLTRLMIFAFILSYWT